MQKDSLLAVNPWQVHQEIVIGNKTGGMFRKSPILLLSVRWATQNSKKSDIWAFISQVLFPY